MKVELDREELTRLAKNWILASGLDVIRDHMHRELRRLSDKLNEETASPEDPVHKSLIETFLRHQLGSGSGFPNDRCRNLVRESTARIGKSALTVIVAEMEEEAKAVAERLVAELEDGPLVVVKKGGDYPC